MKPILKPFDMHYLDICRQCSNSLFYFRFERKGDCLEEARFHSVDNNDRFHTNTAMLSTN